MNHTLTSFRGLFDLGIRSVCIPRLQREYAQGRDDATAKGVRRDFLAVLHGALTTDQPVGLDFVFGDVSAEGVLSPLDGQQRLTTLFLLHWYLASRADLLHDARGWMRFTYDTRASARRFCQELVEHRAPPARSPSEWIKDQPWFLSSWSIDPTVTSMLVMLHDLHLRFGEVDAARVWERLVDPTNPAVSFHLLRIHDLGSPDVLYLRMNSRGKPLTQFENFKATFEQSLVAVYPERRGEFATKVDGAWSDMLWPMRGEDDLIDDEFMRYLDFVAEVCAWRGGRTPAANPRDRAEEAFGLGRPDARGNLDFLFDALDAWCGLGEAVGTFFARHFTFKDHEPGKVAIYGAPSDDPVDLLAACCRAYGELQGKNRKFTLQRTLLLYATVVHRAKRTADFARRIRVVRNVIEATDGDLTPAMSARSGDVARYIETGNLADLAHFNGLQLDDERRKEDFLRQNPALAPTLFALEDHPLLRGSLGAFALDAATFARRAATFGEVFADASLYPKLTGALLACGDYSHRYRSDRFRIGGMDGRTEPWRELFVSSNALVGSGTRAALMTLLDGVAAEQGPMPARLDAVRAKHLAAMEAAGEFDWRYHLARHPEARRGVMGIYVGDGYSLCALNKTQLNGIYWDPYLFAIWRIWKESGAPAGAVLEPRFDRYVAERWMRLPRSDTWLRCVEAGIELSPPDDPAHRAAFDVVCARHQVGTDHVLSGKGMVRDGRMVDTVDRVALGVALLKDLVAAGC